MRVIGMMSLKNVRSENREQMKQTGGSSWFARLFQINRIGLLESCQSSISSCKDFKEGLETNRVEHI